MTLKRWSGWALFAAVMLSMPAYSQERLRIQVRDVDSGGPVSGAVVIATTQRGTVHTCDPSPVVCLVENLKSGETVDIQVTPATDGRFMPREIGVVAGECRSSPCELMLYLLPRSRQANLRFDLSAAKEYRSLKQQDRALVVLAPHRGATNVLNSEGAVCAQYLLAAAEEILCFDAGYATCNSSEAALERLLAELRSNAGIFQSCRVSESLLKRDLEEHRQRREIQQRYRKLVALFETRTRTCDAAQSLAELGREYEQDPERWLRHGISLGLLVRDEVLARRLCYREKKRGSADRAELKQHLESFESKVREAVDLLGGSQDFDDALTFISNESTLR